MFTAVAEAVVERAAELVASEVAKIAAGTCLGLTMFYVGRTAGTYAYDLVAPPLNQVWDWMRRPAPTIDAAPAA
jgi:hypothetical protein